jgi:hypothetical protein
MHVVANMAPQRTPPRMRSRRAEYATWARRSRRLEGPRLGIVLGERTQHSIGVRQPRLLHGPGAPSAATDDVAKRVEIDLIQGFDVLHVSEEMHRGCHGRLSTTTLTTLTATYESIAELRGIQARVPAGDGWSCGRMTAPAATARARRRQLSDFV